MSTTENQRNRPYKIGFEGLDGAGKTTQITSLLSYLEALGLRVCLKTSPGKRTLSGETMRANILQLDPIRALRLFEYDIVRSQREISFGTQLVIWDRHMDSVRISNTDAAVDLEDGKVDPLDLTYYLDIPVDMSWKREEATSSHPINKAWIKDKHRRYQMLLDRHPEKYQIIDATQDLDVVYRAILTSLLDLLKPTVEKQRMLHELIIDTPGILRFVLDEPVEVKPNVFLPMFVNIKSTMEKPTVRRPLTEQLVEVAKEGNFDYVMGLESGGSYFSVSIANELGLPVCFHRTKQKTYSGATGDIVGVPPPKGSRVLLVDDVYATGQSGSRAVNRLKQLGCSSTLITVFSYSSDEEMRQRLGVEATSLTYFKGIRHIVEERGTLNSTQIQRLTELVDIYRHTIYE